MRILLPALATVFAGGTVPLVQLLLIRFPTYDVALNTSGQSITFGGITYLGAAGLGEMQAVRDSAGEAPGLELTLNGGDASLLGIALDAADEFQGAPVFLRTAVLDPTTYQVIDAPLEFSGYGDTFVVEEDGASATIRCTAESDQVDLLRGHPLTASHADQQSLYPDDLAYQYRVSQEGQPVVWPVKEYFFK